MTETKRTRTRKTQRPIVLGTFLDYWRNRRINDTTSKHLARKWFRAGIKAARNATAQ